MATQLAVAEPDTTEETLGLLRSLRRARARAQAANMAFWLYVISLIVLIYAGWLIEAIVRAFRHRPPPGALTPDLLRAAPAGLGALALLVLVSVLWDARWRGPVMVAQPTADWLLDTPVRRSRLLRPRFRFAVALSALAGAAAGLVPAVLLLGAGLGGGGTGQAVRLAGVAMLSTGMLAALATGAAAWMEAHPNARGPRAATTAIVAAAVAIAGLAALTAAFRLPAVIATVLLWSGPWGWAAQGPVALAGGNAPLWPLATGLLAAAAVGLVVTGDRVAAEVPAAALRTRARTMGSMSAAVLNLDARRVTTAYRGAVGTYGRVRFGIRMPLRRRLVLPWRDLTALLRAPSRLVWSALLSFAAVGLGALAVRSPHAALLSLAAALTFGYFAAAGLCEGARLDGDDPSRSGNLPFRYETLVWWHAIVPVLALAVLAGGPAAALAVVTGHPRLLVLVAAAIPVLVGGALVNSFRGELEGRMFQGFETPLGNSSGVTVFLWYVTGPLLAIGPMIVLLYRSISTERAGTITWSVVLSIALAAWLGAIARGRARRLRST
jgi:Family of unknown function (DUF6297)